MLPSPRDRQRIAAPLPVRRRGDELRLHRIVADVGGDDRLDDGVLLDDAAVEAPLPEVAGVLVRVVVPHADPLLEGLQILGEVVHPAAVSFLLPVDLVAVSVFAE